MFIFLPEYVLEDIVSNFNFIITLVSPSPTLEPVLTELGVYLRS